MAKCGVTNIRGGGGIGSDEVSATKDNVLSGKTYVGADTNDEIGTGTMTNNGTTGNQSLNAGSSFLVKKGYHAQDFTVGVNSLASQTPGNADAGSVLSGRSAWVNGNKVNGSMPWQNVDVSGTDRAWATKISCWEGAACLGVRNAHYLNGVNWIQGNIPNFYAGNIKKGVNMGGLVGTFEGYVAGATDLYYRGNNVAGWYGGANLNDSAFGAGQITIPVYNGSRCIVSGNVSTVGKNYLNIEFTVTNTYNNYLGESIYVSLNSIAGTAINMKYNIDSLGGKTFSYPISAYQLYGAIVLSFNRVEVSVFRIWLS